MSTIPANMSRRPLSMIISQVITIFAQLTHCHHQRTRSTPLRAHVTQHVLMCVSAQRTHTPITTFRPGPHGLCPRRAFARRPPAAFRPGPHGLCPRQTLPSRACPSACHSSSRHREHAHRHVAPPVSITRMPIGMPLRHAHAHRHATPPVAITRIPIGMPFHYPPPRT